MEGCVTAVLAVRQDKLATDIVHKATDHTLEQFLLQGNERVYKTNQDIWVDVIAAGRKEGVVKKNLTDDRIIEIIRSLNALLVMRNESPSNQRAFLKDVLIPAIVVSPKI